MKNIYADQEIININKNKYHTKYFSKDLASIEKVNNAYILPAKRVSGTKNSFYLGGIVDSNKKFVPLSAHLREKKEGSLHKAYAFDKKTTKFENKKVIYGGFFNNHFGHFLVETVSRLWYWLEHQEENLDIVFIQAKNKKTPPQIWEFLEILGISKNKIRILEEITQFREIIIPSQATIIKSAYNEKFINIYQAMAKKVEPKNVEKIYLSRTKLKKGTICFGEELIEKTFKENGYKIIYPEKISLKEQISYLNNAKEIAGLSGTALHLALFAKPKTKLISLERSDCAIEEQILINQAMQLDAYYVGANANPVPIDHSAGPVLVTITESLAKFFNEHHFKYDTQKIGYVKKKYLKFFIKHYFKIYLKADSNKDLAETAPLVAKRIATYFKALKPFWQR
ncbi:MAG: glycosyltransferase 61 family protein [Alphaproteobacteria bacterium]|nr:glycosyltransferase 61 family protein [Alphaproteobacteria bacterium]